MSIDSTSLARRIYEYRHINNGNYPEFININDDDFVDLEGEIRRLSFSALYNLIQQKPKFMGVRILRSRDLERGELILSSR